MQTFLILTVGTGTAGRTSNLEAGLRRTIELIHPSAFWLIPSTDEISQTMADLVRLDQPAFRAWDASSPYRAIARPDSLDDCRQIVRKVILRPHKDAQGKWRALVIFVDSKKWPAGKQVFLNGQPRSVSLDLYDAMKTDPQLHDFVASTSK